MFTAMGAGQHDLSVITEYQYFKEGIWLNELVSLIYFILLLKS